MKIKVLKKDLLPKLQIVNTVTKNKDIYPILKNVMVEAINGSLFLKATDLSMSVTVRVEEVEIQEEGRVLLDAEKLGKIVSDSKKDEIKITKQDYSAQIICDGKFKVLGEEPEKFPAIPETESTNTITINRKAFLKLIRKTVFATTKEKSRYDLDTVCLNIKETEVSFIATDGKRLALATENIENGQKLTKVLQAGILRRFEKIFSILSQEFMSLSFKSDNHLVVISENFVASLRISEQAFPPYEKVIPQGLKKVCVVPRLELLETVRRISDFSQTDNKFVILRFDENKLIVSAASEGGGEGSLEIICKYTESPIEIKFNPDYFLDSLRVIEKSEVTIALKDEKTAILITEDNFKYVLLPIKPVES